MKLKEENNSFIIDSINKNLSKASICRELKCKPSTLDNYLKKIGIKYEGNRGLKGLKESNQRLHSSYYLGTDKYITSHHLKIKLIEDNLKEEKCEICSMIKWNNKKIPLELHHLDGNHFNNSLENLQIICPNCHAQTDNNSGKSNLKEKIVKEKTRKVYYCSCGKEIKRRSKFCEECSHINSRKVTRPDKQTLLKDIEELGYCGTGRKYKVSDNAIRKWLK